VTEAVDHIAYECTVEIGSEVGGKRRNQAGFDAAGLRRFRKQDDEFRRHELLD
jgi:hypothetical protein